jgi:hypothetical protein
MDHANRGIDYGSWDYFEREKEKKNRNSGRVEKKKTKKWKRLGTRTTPVMALPDGNGRKDHT